MRASTQIRTCFAHTHYALFLLRPQVRCCSDVKLSASWGTLRSGCAVWGESDAVWTCKRGKTYTEAEAICKNAGARLCTAAELVAGCAAGTGCGFDNALVWGVLPSPSPPPISPPPPSPPPPSPPPPSPLRSPSQKLPKVRLTFLAAVSVNDFANASAGLQSSIAKAAGVRPGAVAITFETARVRITASITLEAGEMVPPLVRVRLAGLGWG